jgi:hypothetical protein
MDPKRLGFVIYLVLRMHQFQKYHLLRGSIVDICSVPTLFVWCSVLLPSLLIIVCLIFGIFYHCFVVNRQIYLEKPKAWSRSLQGCVRVVIHWCWYRQSVLNIMVTEALQDSSIVGVRAGGLARAPLDCCGWRLLLLKELEKQQSSVARAHAA